MANAAHTTIASKIDRGAIMRTAWEQVKGWFSLRSLPFKFSRAEFQYALRCAWHDARFALMSATEKRIDEIERSLMFIRYGSGSARDRLVEVELRAELATLKA